MRLIGFGESFGLAGLSVGMGTIGAKMGSAGMQATSGLTEGAAVGAKFVSPMVNISAGGSIIGMLRDFNKRL